MPRSCFTYTGTTDAILVGDLVEITDPRFNKQGYVVYVHDADSPAYPYKNEPGIEVVCINGGGFFDGDGDRQPMVGLKLISRVNDVNELERIIMKYHFNLPLHQIEGDLITRERARDYLKMVPQPLSI